jgi:hypothetical protein
MSFPPDSPTTLTVVIPSYLYQQYNDDEDLAAFVFIFNQMTQQYVTWFAGSRLPVYADNPQIIGSLLDFVGEGLYDIKRPVLPAGNVQAKGPLNTYSFNEMALDDYDAGGPTQFYVTDDDLYRRVLTWHLYKGDGKLFDIQWLKRRIMRFLTGADGTPGQTDQTYQVSVTFGANHEVNINLQSTRRFSSGGAIMGAGLMNEFYLNEYETTSVQIPVSPYVKQFKAAVENGTLELPFQFTWIVNIN